MYLKSLVLKGFKSFANRSVLTFRPGISAIVGPNGSGKSNISDAVLWVLGELNPKNLRGNSMQDVIFAGSSAKKPVSMAEVTLVLDNSDGTLPVEFDEVSITRRMYRSGESEYLINGTIARRMDVLDILHDSGLGTGTSSIISQGHLNSVLASKPEDRRALIEEAAGILKHKQRKQKSMRKLERMDQSLVRVHDIVSEVERQVRPLARKAHKAQRYADLSEELAQVKLELAVDDLRTMQREWDALKKRKSDAAQSVAAHAKELHDGEKALAALQQQLQTDAHDVSQAQEAYRRGQTIVDKLESNVMLLHQREQSAHDYLDEMDSSSQAQRIQLQSLKESLAASKSSLEQARKDQQSARARVVSAEKREADCRQERDRIQHELDQAYERRKKHNASLRDAQNRFNALRQDLNDARGNERSLTDRAERLQHAIAAAKHDVESAQTDHANAQSNLNQGRQRLSLLNDQLKQARENRDAMRQQADEAQDAWSRIQAELAGLQEVERAHAAQNPLLAWVRSHAHDAQANQTLLIDALDVPEDVSGVVNQILGSDVDGIVVDTLRTAADIISDAQEERQPGRVSITASRVEGAQATPPADQPPHRFEPKAEALLDRIGYSEGLADVCALLFGDVYVCQNAEDAAELAEAHPDLRFATSDGVVFGPFGKAILEHEGEHDDNPVARHRRINQARRDLSAAEEKRAQAKRRLSEFDASIDDLSQRCAEASRAKAQQEGELSAATSALSRATNHASSLASQMEHVQSKLDQAKRRVVEMQPKVNAAEKAREDAEQALASIGSDSDDLERKIVPARSDLEAATSELVSARSLEAAANERVRSLQGMIDQRTSDIASQEKQLLHSRQGVLRKDVALRRIGPLIQVCERLVSEAKVRTSELSDAAHKTQETSDALRQRINQASEHVQDLRSSYDAQQKASSDIRVDEGRMQMRVTNAMQVIADDCHTPVEEALKLPQVEDRKTRERQAFDLEGKIKRIGNVDPDAQHEYEQLTQRLDYLRSQVADMQQARASLTKIVGYIDDRMQHDFEDTFKQVDQNYREIFHQLFPGGSGKLVLTDPDDPDHSGVEVIAQPRGKRFLKMSLLSGGEQSLVAMALLFALYRTRSTPFYILDEVEAALDDTNLRRLLSYINEARSTMQFIAITHQRRTMELADVLFGVSMKADGISHVISQKLSQARPSAVSHADVNDSMNKA